MIIVGAGLAGLLAANMLRKHNPTIYESQKELPNNHTALLRHRDGKVSDATSIPFKKVQVHKAISYRGDLYKDPQINFTNMYSRKVTGAFHGRSISNLETVERYIAPSNFIQKLAMGCNIEFGIEIDFSDFKSKGSDHPPLISTIPMPIIARALGYDVGVDFEYRNITVINFYILDPDCDLYQTIYYPNPSEPIYRLSITGNKVIAEFVEYDGNIQAISNRLIRDFGIDIDRCAISDPQIKENKYGKIKDIDDGRRKEFISLLTRKYNIYSLGRYAVWKNILLDDVHDDILIIQKMIENNGYYAG